MKSDYSERDTQCQPYISVLEKPLNSCIDLMHKTSYSNILHWV